MKGKNMKKMNFTSLRCSVILLFAAFTLTLSAQPKQQNKKLYSFNQQGVYYERQPIRDADYRTFVDLGFGYAKDRYNVYYMGRILPYVDPYTFSLRIAVKPYPDDYSMDDDYDDDDDDYRYRITNNAVIFRGNKISDSPRSFKDLGWGYGKDNFNVYYKGKKIDGAFTSTFRVLENGYAEDTFESYYKGKRIK